MDREYSGILLFFLLAHGKESIFVLSILPNEGLLISVLALPILLHIGCPEGEVVSKKLHDDG